MTAETDKMVIRAMRVVIWGVIIFAALLAVQVVVIALRDRPCPSCAKCPTAERP